MIVSEKVTVYVGTGLAPDPSPPGIVTKDYIESSDIDARIAAAIAAFAATLASFTMKFAGAFPGLVSGTASRYLPDSAGTIVQTTPLGYSVPACRVSKVRFHCVANAAIADVTVTLYKNGAPTAHTHTFAAGTTGFAISVGDVDFNDDDTIDVFATSTDAGTGTVQLVVSPYISPIQP